MNTTTLNMTTLDGGNVIIKRGTAPAPPSGGSNWRYYDVSELDGMDKLQLVTSMLFIKVKDNDNFSAMIGKGDAIIPYSTLSVMGTIQDESIKAMATDINMKVIMGGREITIGDALLTNPSTELATEITEAEFYNLD